VPINSIPATGNRVTQRNAVRALKGPHPGIWNSVSGTADGTTINQILAVLRNAGLLDLNPNLVLNGDGTTGTAAWISSGHGALSEVSGHLRLTVNDGNFPEFYQELVGITAGETYRVTATGYAGGGGQQPKVQVGTTTLGADLVFSGAFTGPFDATFVAPAGSVYINISGSTFVTGDYCELDDIVVKQIS
jgi:hypothetical protein